MTRKYTCKLLEMIDEGMLNKDLVIEAFTSYMSEADVKEMMRINDFLMPGEDDEDEGDES